jgi:hypothetical protein
MTVPADFTGIVRDPEPLAGPAGDTRVYFEVREYEHGREVDRWVTSRRRKA